MNFKKILFKTSEIDVEKVLPDAVIYCDNDGKILWVNDKAAEIFETSKMHLLTSNITNFIENPLGLALNSITSSKPVITKLVSKDQYYDMTASQTDGGYVLDFRDAVSIDVSEKTSEQVNTPVNRDKNNFLIKLANDLKSPLQSMVGFSQAMLDGLGGNLSEQQEKYIRIINKNSNELTYFISKLLELSQTESCLPKAEYKTFDIINLINSTVRFNEQLYKDKDIRWNISLAEGMKNAVSTDDNVIKNIIQNILEVILKPVEMGEIAINVSQPDEEFVVSKGLKYSNNVLINISCSSLLLSEGDLDCLFDPYKIVESPNRKNILRAIILSSVKNLVNHLNGTLWVESQILKSTSFNILIPQSVVV